MIHLTYTQYSEYTSTIFGLLKLVSLHYFARNLISIYFIYLSPFGGVHSFDDMIYQKREKEAGNYFNQYAIHPEIELLKRADFIPFGKVYPVFSFLWSATKRELLYGRLHKQVQQLQWNLH